MGAAPSIGLAREGDLPAVAQVYLDARAAAMMPPGVHAPEDVRAWVGSWDLTARDVWVVRRDATVVGFANLTRTWLDGLYVAPSAQRLGLGSRLLDVAKSHRPHGFALWVFAMNTAARNFYRGQGLREVETTDGSGNEEREPDVRMVWSGAEHRAQHA